MQKGISFIIKRLFDFLFGFLLLICSSPFFLIAALSVKIASPESPILFRQERMGYKNRRMTIYKLRSMTNEKDEDGNLLPDEARLKKWGTILRRTNLDEIPQVWNVMKGEMSLIGPRPLLPREMLIMNYAEQNARQSVLPGITGWEAVNEGKTDTRHEMAQYDLYYANHWSLALDCEIFVYTAFIVLFNRRPDDSLRAPKIENELPFMDHDLKRQASK